MKVVFIGCVDFSYALLETLADLPEAEIVLVVTKSASSANADFRSLEPLAQSMGAPCINVDRQPSISLAGEIAKAEADVVFCFGWSHLLSRPVLDAAAGGVVGYHPALLPQNRGRHPIIWALALGLATTGSTFFIMDEGADSGDILDQAVVAIDDDDDAGTLYEKLKAAAKLQLVSIVKGLAGGTLVPRKQDHSAANTWRKRSAADGMIDWRMSATAIHNLVRALAHPYPGADCRYGGEPVKIWKTALAGEILKNLEPGKVLRHNGRQLVVQCGEGAIRILDHEFPELPEIGSCL